MLQILAPAIRIMVLWAFTRFATLGYFTPEDANTFTKVAMDALMYGAPLAYAWWATRRERPAAKIEAVAELPQVAKVELNSERLAQAIPSPKVVA